MRFICATFDLPMRTNILHAIFSRFWLHLRPTTKYSKEKSDSATVFRIIYFFISLFRLIRHAPAATNQKTWALLVVFVAAYYKTFRLLRPADNGG